MSKPFHIYLDLDVMNNDTASSSKPPPIAFEETRNQPFLDGDASDYFVTIARFSIQTGSSLPVFIPSVETGQASLNQTVYKITIEGQGTNGPRVTMPITYVPSDMEASIPQAPLSGQDLTGTYYHVSNYQDFIAMINVCLKNLWLAVNGNPTGSALTELLKYVPFMEMDPSTTTCTLNVPQQFFDPSLQPVVYKLYFNSRLFELFIGLPNIKWGSKGAPPLPSDPVGTTYPDLNYRILARNTGANVLQVSVPNGTSTPDKIPFLQVFQEISSVGLWNPVASIVFTSATLPVHPTLSGAPRLLNSRDNGMIGTGSPNVVNILSDFEIPISATNQYRPEISYVPPGDYRLIDLYSNYNLSKIDLNVYWKDRYGNLHPFLLQPGCSASVKLLFRHKHFYLGLD